MHRIEGGQPSTPNLIGANSTTRLTGKNRQISRVNNKKVSDHLKDLFKGSIYSSTPSESLNADPLRHSKKTIASNPKKHKATPLAIQALSLKIKGSNTADLINKLAEIKNMPAETLDQKAAKEKKFRELIKTQFDLRMVSTDGNNGLRAIIVSLHTNIDHKVEDTLSTMLRGDLIYHIMENPQKYTRFLKKSETEDQGLLNAVLMTYCEKMKKSDEKIGTIEMTALSDILRTPIYLHSYLDPHLDENNHLVPGKEKMLGAHYEREPIHLYHDPLQGNYISMTKKNDKR